MSPPAAPRRRSTARHGSWTGLRHVGRTPPLRGLLLSSWVYWTANAALTVLLVPFVATRLHTSGQALGYLIAGLGAGYLCGSALSGVLIGRWATGTILTVAYASVGLCFLVMFTATTLPVALIAVAASGVPGAVAQVATSHRVQASTPDAVLGRVAAAFHTSDATAAVAGALAAPVVVALAGLGTALWVLSAAVLVAAAIARLAIPARPQQPRRRLRRRSGRRERGEHPVLVLPGDRERGEGVGDGRRGSPLTR